MDLEYPRDAMMLYASDPHPCPYLKDKSSVTAFVDPALNLSSGLYGLLIDLGFRRSGNHLYRPYCPECDSCISVRIPVREFRPTRGQRRTLKRNEHCQVVARPAKFDPRHFQLYCQYLNTRHADSDMAKATERNYMDFLGSNWCDTIFYEFRQDNQLMAVSVVDQLPQGLSAVYTFFDPLYNRFSPGKFAILWLIQEAHRRNLSSLYLGYWIEDCQKMAYKTDYHPLEALIAQRWRPLSKT